MEVKFRAFTVYRDPRAGRAMRYFRRAHRLYREVRHAQKSKAPSPYYEAKLRAALDLLYSAMNWAEADGDEQLFETAHAEVHRVGRFTRCRFGCPIRPKDGRYEQVCPAFLAHKRIGFSPSISVTYACSICHQSAETCPHIDGRRYEEELCRFLPAFGGIAETSVVGIPRMPDNHIAAIPFDIDELAAHLGPGFVPGQPINCDFCLHDCEGFDKYDEHTMGDARAASTTIHSASLPSPAPLSAHDHIPSDRAEPVPNTPSSRWSQSTGRSDERSK